jgi:hypothetical protein
MGTVEVAMLIVMTGSAGNAILVHLHELGMGCSLLTPLSQMAVGGCTLQLGLGSVRRIF